MNNLVIVLGMLLLSFISGMLGLGVAFAAIPFLGLFFSDLVYQIQPLSLLLNGLTASFSAAGFARSKLIDWPKALTLSLITAVSAPIGSYLARLIPQLYLWAIYVGAVSFLAYRLFRPVQSGHTNPNMTLAYGLAIPISILSGLLGVGPGFLLMPTLILVGLDSKRAAAVNAVAVIPPSFSALIPRLNGAQWSLELTIPLLIVGAVGSFLGARVTSLYVPSHRLRQIFAVMIVLVTLYKVYTLLG